MNTVTVRQLIEDDLSYQDADLPKDAKRKALEWSQNTDSANRYARSLLELAQKENIVSVRKSARALLDTALAEAARIGIPVSPYGKSMTWAMWDIGKQSYFFNHPAENDPRYDIGDPLTSEAKRNEIINRHLGWEAYAVFHSKTSPEWNRKVIQDEKFARALELLNKPPKQNSTLSSRDLAELGKVLRE